MEKNIFKKNLIEVEKSVRPKGTITVELHSRSGLLLKKEKFPMHSQVENFWQYIHGYMSGQELPTQTRFNGTTAGSFSGTVGAPNRRPRIYSEAGDAWGLRVGTDSTQMAIDDYSLGGLIAIGSGSGELEHYASLASVNEKSVTLSRGFENFSGSDITIRELGIGCSRYGDSTSETFPYLFARDILDSPFVVGNGEIVTFQAEMFLDSGTYNLAQMFNMMCLPGTPAHEVNVIQRDGVTDQDRVPDDAYGFSTDAGNDYGGIFLGTGDSDVSFNDFDLENRLPQGNTTNTINYGTTSLGAINVDTANDRITWEISRVVENLSGSDLTITEMGLYGNFGTQSFMMDRYILPVPVTFADQDSKTARWRFSYAI